MKLHSLWWKTCTCQQARKQYLLREIHWEMHPQSVASVSLVNNAEQPFDHLPVPTTPLPQPLEQLTPEQSLKQIPCPAAPQVLPSELLTSEQPLNHIWGPTAPQPLHPEYLTNVPSASRPSVQPEDESLTGNCSKVLVDLEKAFSDLTSIGNLEDLVELHSRIRVVQWKS